MWSYHPTIDKWTHVPMEGAAPQGILGQTAVWDPVRAQLLVFGGLNPQGRALWSYRPGRHTWTQLDPEGPLPTSRAYHSAVWDAQRDQMLVFAGLGSGFGLLNDLWAYRPSSNSWVQLEPPRPRPLPVFYHSAVWDPTGAQMLVFGGADPFTGERVDELWSFSVESGAWTELKPAGARPAARLSHVAVWDPIGAQMLLFGGGCGAGCFGDELWSYRPATNDWMPLPAVGASPGPRGGHAGVWDPIAARFIIFGGSTAGGALGDLWAYRPGAYAWSRLAADRPSFLAQPAHSAIWDPAGQQLLAFDTVANRVWAYRTADAAWSDWTPARGAPEPREDPALVWDPTQGRVLMFGGYGQTGYADDVWSYRPAANRWERLAPAGQGPTGRFRHTAVWDPDGAQMLVFGGYRGGALGDLWSYRPASNRWMLLAPSGPAPPGRARHSAVWDAESRQMLVFGGSHGEPLADLWSYRPSSNSWTSLRPSGPTPPTHFLHAAVWDPGGARMLVFGGYGGRRFDELWSYRPADDAWMRLSPWGDPPPARGLHSAIWDPNGARMLVVSGHLGGVSNDLWAFRPASNAWTRPPPNALAPAPRQQHSATWSPTDDSMLVFGGYRTGGEFLADLWRYRPITRSWNRMSADGPAPPARSLHSAVWDDARARLIVFGGYGPRGYFNDLWSYAVESNAWEQLEPDGPRPPAREDHSAVWSPAAGRMLVFGGARDGRGLADLWSYDAATGQWTELMPDGPEPPARFRHTAVWDAAGDQMLVVGGYGGGFPGGYLDDLWSYRPSINAWVQLALDGPRPPPRARHTAIWDAGAQRILVLGGFAGGIDYLADLWSYDTRRGSWTQLSPIGPQPGARSAHTAVWDATRGQMIVCGGYGGALYDELWTYAP